MNQPTRCSNFSGLLLVVLIELKHVSGILMPIIRSSTTAVAASGLPLERGSSSAVGRGRAGLYLYSRYGPYGLYRASVPVQGCTSPYLPTVYITIESECVLESRSLIGI